MDPLECNDCHKKFASVRNRRRHMKEVHGDIKYACPECDKEFPRKDTLKRHMKTHTDEKPHVCEICPGEISRFKTKDHLKKHIKCHERAKYQCDLCELKFIKEETLESHRQLHHN